jgi:hypothetical protein
MHCGIAALKISLHASGLSIGEDPANLVILSKHLSLLPIVVKISVLMLIKPICSSYPTFESGYRTSETW